MTMCEGRSGLWSGQPWPEIISPSQWRVALGLRCRFFAAQCSWLNLSHERHPRCRSRPSKPASQACFNKRAPRRTGRSKISQSRKMIKQVGVIGTWMGAGGLRVFYYLIEIAQMENGGARTLLPCS